MLRKTQKWVAMYKYEVTNSVYSGYFGRSLVYRNVPVVQAFLYVHKNGVVYARNANTPVGSYNIIDENRFRHAISKEGGYTYVTQLEALLLSYPKPPTLSKQTKQKMHRNRKMRNTAPR